MKILWVATKPPWPLIDGGRVLMWHTMEALHRRSLDLTLIAPADDGANSEAAAQELRSICHPILVPRPYRHRLASFSRALLEGAPFTIVHHRSDAVRDRTARLLSSDVFDLVHAEQVHAIANCESAYQAKIPVVFRAQNVESDLWAGLAAHQPILGPILRREARRLRAWEAEAVQRSEVTVALTKRDAAKLASLANQPNKVHHVPAPFPSVFAPTTPSVLQGDPAVVLFGSSGWAPNRDGARWFIGKIWPSISARVRGAVLHAFGGEAIGGNPRNVIQHAPPRESLEAFSPDSILVVPLRIASGVRIKILEAWARGIPVIATPEAAEGLEATDGVELLLAKDSIDFANAIERLHGQAGLREAITSRAREKLRAEHDPASIAENLLAIYQNVLTTRIES
jgi:hypothetical protein